MLIELYDQTNDKGEAILIIRFCHCKNNEVYRVEINKTQTRAIMRQIMLLPNSFNSFMSFSFQ